MNQCSDNKYKKCSIISRDKEESDKKNKKEEICQTSRNETINRSEEKNHNSYFFSPSIKNLYTISQFSFFFFFLDCNKKKDAATQNEKEKNLTNKINYIIMKNFKKNSILKSLKTINCKNENKPVFKNYFLNERNNHSISIKNLSLNMPKQIMIKKMRISKNFELDMNPVNMQINNKSIILDVK